MGMPILLEEKEAFFNGSTLSCLLEEINRRLISKI
jgi:hypothetical protein